MLERNIPTAKDFLDAIFGRMALNECHAVKLWMIINFTWITFDAPYTRCMLAAEMLKLIKGWGLCIMLKRVWLVLSNFLLNAFANFKKLAQLAYPRLVFPDEF